MADEMVKQTQQWLNDTYRFVPGFGTVNVDGYTGWNTIYGLIRGLQWELGITGLVNNFGPGTASKFDDIAGKIKEGYTNYNIIKIIQGGFWCKGINPGAFDGEYSSSLASAISTMKREAGLSNTSSSLNSAFMKALLSMSAFTLVTDGDKFVRTMQQWLNNLYSSNLGILPCDGIFQRDTNTGLIYALQREAGIAADVANGNFGPATETAVRKLNVSTTSNSPVNLVKIIQYGLYLNHFNNQVADGHFSDDNAEMVKKFRYFMKYPNQSSGVADYTVIKGLVTSNGDTSRPSDTFDCATQLLKESAVSGLKAAGYKTAGRYLTGSVGSDFVDKSLSLNEIELLTKHGFSIFPIYEDGGYTESYFNANQGTIDAKIATKKARGLGFPTGTIIYFACDVDLIGDAIPTTVIPYIRAVKASLAGSGYQTGLYGTRNVCSKVADVLGINHFFLADMSYGWSGNLGFPMPTNWTFDQYSGSTVAGVEIDQVVSSGEDPAVSKFNKPATVSVTDALNALWPNFKYDQEVEVLLLDLGWAKVTGKATTSYEDPDGSSAITIKNGKIDEASLGKFIDSLDGTNNSKLTDLVVGTANKLSITNEIEDGRFTVKTSVSSDGSYKYELAWTAYQVKKGLLEETVSAVLEIELNLPKVPGWDAIASVAVAAGVVAGVAFGVALIVTFLPAEAAGGAVALVATFFFAVVKALKNKSKQ